MLCDPTVLLCGKLCQELLSFILEHPEPRLQRMTNRTISKYELADNKCRRLQVWNTGREKKWLGLASEILNNSIVVVSSGCLLLSAVQAHIVFL